MLTFNVFALATICDFSEGLPNVWGERTHNYLLVFLVWRADTKQSLRKFSETGAVGVLDFVSSEERKLVLLLVIYCRVKTQRPFNVLLSQLSSIKIRRVRKSVKFIH